MRSKAILYPNWLLCWVKVNKIIKKNSIKHYAIVDTQREC